MTYQGCGRARTRPQVWVTSRPSLLPLLQTQGSEKAHGPGLSGGHSRGKSLHLGGEEGKEALLGIYFMPGSKHMPSHLILAMTVWSLRC